MCEENTRKERRIMKRCKKIIGRKVKEQRKRRRRRRKGDLRH